MNYEKYDDISISQNSLDYKFLSIGVKGKLNKFIQFNPHSGNDQIYNLALGTIEKNGNVDYTSLSKNGDRDKILATIGAIAYIFSEYYPEKMIFLTGDTESKTRLYQMAINNAHDEILETFIIQGLKIIENKYYHSQFERGTNYDAFLFIRRKINNRKEALEIKG